jgi:hypothetical protein
LFVTTWIFRRHLDSEQLIQKGRRDRSLPRFPNLLTEYSDFGGNPLLLETKQQTKNETANDTHPWCPNRYFGGGFSYERSRCGMQHQHDR